MRSNTVLPVPLRTEIGWPWEKVQSEILRPDIDDQEQWPHFTIVTPSFNQGQYLERTIRSVLLQGYPKLNYLIMDGGSKDNSIDIIKYYSNALAYWRSSPDEGQSAAIQEGLLGAKSDLVAWLNSDDYYLPGTLESVARLWMENGHPEWIVGSSRFVDDQGMEIQVWEPDAPRSIGQALSMGAGTPQPSAFWSKQLWDRVGGLNERLHYCMDEDLWMRFQIAGATPFSTKSLYAVRHLQRESKTVLQLPRFANDFSELVIRHSSFVPSSEKAQWIKGCRVMARYYGLQTSMLLRNAQLRGALLFFQSAWRLSPFWSLTGLGRGLGSAVKTYARAIIRKSTP